MKIIIQFGNILIIFTRYHHLKYIILKVISHNRNGGYIKSHNRNCSFHKFHNQSITIHIKVCGPLHKQFVIENNANQSDSDIGINSL